MRRERGWNAKLVDPISVESGPMMEVIKDGLRNLGISGDRVNTEYFAAPTSKNAADEKPSQSTDFNGVSEVTLTVYGKTHIVQNPLAANGLGESAHLQDRFSAGSFRLEDDVRIFT